MDAHKIQINCLIAGTSAGEGKCEPKTRICFSRCSKHDVLLIPAVNREHKDQTGLILLQLLVMFSIAVAIVM